MLEANNNLSPRRLIANGPVAWLNTANNFEYNGPRGEFLGIQRRVVLWPRVTHYEGLWSRLNEITETRTNTPLDVLIAPKE